MAHTHHPQIREQGLADGCLDCAAYADDPWFMDTENFANLVHEPRIVCIRSTVETAIG